jgi:hypothetical protein
MKFRKFLNKEGDSDDEMGIRRSGRSSFVEILWDNISKYSTVGYSD